MRRFGGDLKNGKRILMLFVVLSAFLSFFVFWYATGKINSFTLFSVSLFWIYSLILLPVILAFIVNFAWRKFERITR